MGDETVLRCTTGIELVTSLETSRRCGEWPLLAEWLKSFGNGAELCSQLSHFSLECLDHLILCCYLCLQCCDATTRCCLCCCRRCCSLSGSSCCCCSPCCWGWGWRAAWMKHRRGRAARSLCRHQEDCFANGMGHISSRGHAVYLKSDRQVIATPPNGMILRASCDSCYLRMLSARTSSYSHLCSLWVAVGANIATCWGPSLVEGCCLAQI